MVTLKNIISGLLFIPLLLTGCKKDPENHGTMQLFAVKAGTVALKTDGVTEGIRVDSDFTLEFSNSLDQESARAHIRIEQADGTPVEVTVIFAEGLNGATLKPAARLKYFTEYRIVVDATLKGAAGESYAGVILTFQTEQGKLKVTSVTLNGKALEPNKPQINVSLENAVFEVRFSDPINPDNFQDNVYWTPRVTTEKILSPDHMTLNIRNTQPLQGYTRYSLYISSNLVSSEGYTFDGYNAGFYTALDSTYKFPVISDAELLELIQKQTFKYFWDYAHPASGMARERNSSGDIVTSGGTGFGIMCMIVAMEREFITRSEGIERLDKLLRFLETCDRFHGAWPHWLNGTTGKVVPFSTRDDGGDLVETSFLIQGLLAMRSYLNPGFPGEESLISRITALWEAVEWSWYQNGQEVLYWHWSPNYNFGMNMQIRGYNETLITYVLAASSPTHPIPATAYHKGFASNGGMRNGKSFYGIKLPLGYDYGGPLFFEQYTFLGLDPRNLSDQYASYWEQVVNHSRINYQYCVVNPKGYIGYSADCWGLTASDNPSGYSAHSPTNDLGVITPTAAISSLPFVPEESMRAIRHFYYLLGNKLWGPCGFYDAFSVNAGWWADSYIAIDQGPIPVMIENYRTHLIWDLFMGIPEIREGLNLLGFSY
jgi:hypothetical protein